MLKYRSEYQICPRNRNDGPIRMCKDSKEQLDWLQRYDGVSCKTSTRRRCLGEWNSSTYFMLSGRISRNIGENNFRSYTGSTSENTNFHVLVA